MSPYRVSAPLKPRTRASDNTGAMLGVCIVGFSIFALLIIATVIISIKCVRRRREERERRLGGVAVGNNGVVGGYGSYDGTGNGRGEGGESRVEVGGGLWPPIDATGVLGMDVIRVEGKDGKDGKDGRDGQIGQHGKDGKSDKPSQNATNHVANPDKIEGNRGN